MFYDAQGNLDFRKVVTTAFLNKYWEKVDGFRKQQIRNTTKRELGLKRRETVWSLSAVGLS